MQDILMLEIRLSIKKCIRRQKKKQQKLQNSFVVFMGKKVYNTHSLIMGKLYLPIRVVVLVEQKIKR